MSLFRHWKSILLVALVFVAGAACGAVGTVRAIQREYRNKLDESTWTPRTLEWLRKAASLTVAQEEELRPIIDDAMMQMKELRDGSEAKRKSIVKELLLAVAIKLPEPQQEQLKRSIIEAMEKPSPWGGAGMPSMEAGRSNRK
ncbi:MAG: hypothetical protein C0483_05270 [Pirellula sp.]|nr:hypothetical protein [Pirellula sp.]